MYLGKQNDVLIFLGLQIILLEGNAGEAWPPFSHRSTSSVYRLNSAHPPTLSQSPVSSPRRHNSFSVSSTVLDPFLSSFLACFPPSRSILSQRILGLPLSLPHALVVFVLQHKHAHTVPLCVSSCLFCKAAPPMPSVGLGAPLTGWGKSTALIPSPPTFPSPSKPWHSQCSGMWRAGVWPEKEGREIRKPESRSSLSRLCFSRCLCVAVWSPSLELASLFKCTERWRVRCQQQPQNARSPGSWRIGCPRLSLRLSVGFTGAARW